MYKRTSKNEPPSLRIARLYRLDTDNDWCYKWPVLIIIGITLRDRDLYGGVTRGIESNRQILSDEFPSEAQLERIL
jgi:hypothetical protein